MVIGKRPKEPTFAEGYSFAEKLFDIVVCLGGSRGMPLCLFGAPSNAAGRVCNKSKRFAGYQHRPINTADGKLFSPIRLSRVRSDIERRFAASGLLHRFLSRPLRHLVRQSWRANFSPESALKKQLNPRGMKWLFEQHGIPE